MIKLVSSVWELVVGGSIVFYYWKWFASGGSITIIQGVGLYMLVRLIVYGTQNIPMLYIYNDEESIELAFPLFILGLGFLFSHLIGWIGLI